MGAYVFTPPDRRQSLRVAGRWVQKGDPFEATEAFVASQPAGWCTPAAEYVAPGEAPLASPEVVRRAAGSEPLNSRVRVIEVSVEETVVAAEPGVFDEEGNPADLGEDEQVDDEPAVPTVAAAAPPKRGPGRPPKNAPPAPRAEA
jgi:hypothetical protein